MSIQHVAICGVQQKGRVLLKGGNAVMSLRLLAFAQSALVICALIAPVSAQEPQSVLDGLIRQRQEQRRADLEDQLRYRRASDAAIEAELRRCCPSDGSACRPLPPPLFQEAARRGMIRTTPRQGGVECVTLGGYGMAVTDCD
jgi:hypothetical protein